MHGSANVGVASGLLCSGGPGAWQLEHHVPLLPPPCPDLYPPLAHTPAPPNPPPRHHPTHPLNWCQWAAVLSSGGPGARQLKQQTAYTAPPPLVLGVTTLTMY
jgi:hypothetical protein